MKDKRTIYFVAPLFAREQYGKYYKMIADILRDFGYFVWDDVNHVTADEARKMSEKEIRDYFTEIEKRIRNTDLFVAESSETSASIGYETGFAIAYSKPVLLLRSDKLENQLGAPFRGNSSKLMTILKYNDKNLKKQIEKFLRKAEKGIFVKRMAIEFTQEQVDYINFRQTKKIKKSFNAAVREIVHDASINDKDYKNS